MTTGEGGDLILATAERVLRDEFPALAERIRLRIPDEKEKRHGQAIAAASLPVSHRPGGSGGRGGRAPPGRPPELAERCTREEELCPGEDVMHFSRPDADVFVPDGTPMPEALRRATHLCIGAHQDDLEIMAFHGIAECFGRKDRGFAGVVVTNGGGSSRTGIYADYTDAEMLQVRVLEQRKAAYVGEYACEIQLMHPSADVKKPGHPGVVADLTAIFGPSGPRCSTSTIPPTSTTRTWPCACGHSRRSARCRRRSGRSACSAARSGATSTG